jgi:cell wall-associated NlpC family hydrolase
MPTATVISREDAVKVARSWIGTPYVLGGRVKGAGCDCASLLAEFLIECGFAEREDLGVYSHDWFCHTSNERYMFRLIRHARKTIEGRCRGTVEAHPGDLVLFKLPGSKLYNHGGIITRWPHMIHATGPVVKEQNCVTHWMTGFTEFAVFDPWGK